MDISLTGVIFLWVIFFLSFFFKVILPIFLIVCLMIIYLSFGNKNFKKMKKWLILMLMALLLLVLIIATFKYMEKNSPRDYTTIEQSKETPVSEISEMREEIKTSIK
jgi:membrane protein implicated in regulation of membrane protease activity